MSEQEPRSTAAALVAALAPVPGLFLAALALVALSRGQLIGMLREGGTWSYAAIAAAGLGFMACAGLGAVAAWGARVPVAIPIGFAVLPFLLGAVGMGMGVQMASRAVAMAAPDMRALIMTAGVGEAAQSRVLGAMLSAGLLGAVGLGFAAGAVGRKAKNRGLPGLALFGGVGAAIPILAVIVSLSRGHFDLALLPAAVTGLFGAGVLALAGFGVGEDPSGRAGALAAGAAVAVGLAFMVAAIGGADASVGHVLKALTQVAPDDRLIIVAQGAAEAAGLVRVAAFSPVALVVVAGLAASAFWRNPSRSLALEGGLLLLIAFVVFAAASVGSSTAREELERHARAPWAGIAGFEPAVVPDGASAERLAAFVGPSGAWDAEGKPLGADALEKALKAGVHPDSARNGSRGLLGSRDDDPAERGGTAVTVAVDGRVGRPRFLELVGLARTAGAQAIVVVGAAGRSHPELAAALGDVPVLGVLASQATASRIPIETDATLAGAELDPQLWHATVEGPDKLVLAQRAGPLAETRELLLGMSFGAQEVPKDVGVAWLRMGEKATVADVARVANRAASAGLPVRLLAGDAFPGHPERPAPSPVREADAVGGLLGGVDPQGATGLGFLGTRSHSNPPQVRQGSTVVMGSLDKEIIQRVIHRNLAQVKYCYEKSLLRNPVLAGKVTVKMVIGASGEVSSAIVQESTMKDPEVEGCIAERVRTWRFPGPKGGGIVVVVYPFIFRTAG